jgi:N-acetylmuramoyl-L-alanine amidase
MKISPCFSGRESIADRRGTGIMAFTINANQLRQDGKPVLSLPSPYIGGALPSPTRCLVMHFTYGASALSSAKWFQSQDNPGSSAHLVIDRDGSVIQCVRFDKVAWHAGKSTWRGISGLNQHAIGIELANWGPLHQAGSEWKSHTGVTVAHPHMARHKNGNPHGEKGPIGWEPYPPVQFETAVEVARLLVKSHGVEEIVGHDDISPDRKCDPGPAFDMARFRSLVFGGRADDGGTSLRVDVAEGLNLRTGPGTTFPVARLLPAGTLVEPIERDGRWLGVSVLNAQGQPSQTGWVHEHYLS